MARVFLIVCLLVSAMRITQQVTSSSKEKELIRHLLDGYEGVGRLGRPVNNSDETVVVYYGLSMIQILDLDERNQVLTVNVWGNYRWSDVFLVWDPADYGNITSVRVPAESIWLPDIKLYNYADMRLNELRDSLVVVYSTGSLLWVPQAIYKSSCSIDITYFPFDEQKCTMKFGSWTYDGAKLDVAFFFENETGFDFQDYICSNEWDITEYSSERHVKKYSCCPEIYPDLKFKLNMKRKVAFYNYILILPCVLLSSLTLVLFWLPPESPAKMQLGMNIFVAFFVLLLLLAESTPPAASSIPLIGAYYCLNMVLITLSTFLSVIVVKLYFHGNRTILPELLKTIMIEWIARLLCMRNLVKTYSADKSTDEKLAQPCEPLQNGKKMCNDRYAESRQMNSTTPSHLNWQSVDQSGTLNMNWSYPDEPPPPPPNANWPYMGISPYTKTHTLKASNENIPYTSNKLMYCNDRLAYSNDGLAYDKYRGRYHVPPRDEQNLVSRESIISDVEERMHATTVLERLDVEVTEIKLHVRSLTDRITDKELKDRVGREWKGLALVLDRVFFFIYLGAIVVSIFTIFPQSVISNWTTTEKSRKFSKLCNMNK